MIKAVDVVPEEYARMPFKERNKLNRYTGPKFLTLSKVRWGGGGEMT